MARELRPVIYEIAPGIFTELDDETRRLLGISKSQEGPYQRRKRKRKKMNEDQKPQERPVTNEELNRAAIADELARMAKTSGRKVPHEI